MSNIVVLKDIEISQIMQGKQRIASFFFSSGLSIALNEYGEK